MRVEDAALLTGRGRYFDDLPAPGGVLHAAVVRSLHAHARVQSIEIAAASALPGVRRVITGADYAALAAPLMVGLKLPIDCWPIAQDKTRYVGEPVAVVLADDRYMPKTPPI